MDIERFKLARRNSVERAFLDTCISGKKKVYDDEKVASPLALVTGASSGIGRAYAEKLAESGYRLILVSKDPLRLEAAVSAIGDQVIQSHAVDLAQPESVRRLLDMLPKLEVIIANAGITQVTPLGATETPERQKLYYLLCGGVIDLLEDQIPRMRASKRGRVVIMSSIAARTPMPKSSLYASAKTAVASYGSSIAQEVKRDGVQVTTCLPGYVRTEAHTRAGLQHLHRNIPDWMWLSPEQVVEECEKASLSGKATLIPGKVYKTVRPFLGSRLANDIWRSLTRR
ncbi:MAG: SDR family NAD(P)-dependent oxidoreductase [Pseudomonadales bacterium]|nr:SDR family NAD(P)-dependent oxidoreductase [Pseudomonadales bacterium]MBO6597599.1 SDR family NAD(P)-dependent oxidoreductase [Pseudomonadales bacterium]MBO6657744.1 SDR family NAD(P)-dependent oxidoreductase [Pseudomonadales bacterium]MBO6704205.1 SDR family NAD(P)-dependent oxidoreductase [Pseudomonadales bacterium]MBO6824351.1 SDR family NAD(P)-dependent oxidoreductase [Pseudomonadales bacterium]